MSGVGTLNGVLEGPILACDWWLLGCRVCFGLVLGYSAVFLACEVGFGECISRSVADFSAIACGVVLFRCCSQVVGAMLFCFGGWAVWGLFVFSFRVLVWW